MNEPNKIPFLTPYNPLDKRRLGESVVSALMSRPVVPLDALEPFGGAGVYAVYYEGNFPLYAAFESAREKRPIYVGKAVPAGARKGGLGLSDNPGTALFNRLKEHSESVKAAENLNVDDFQCRFLAVDDIWIPLAESLLIATYSPLWNVVVDGFGNHDPGKGRRNQRRSQWDALHPGREWAKALRENDLPLDELIRRVRAYCDSLT